MIGLALPAAPLTLTAAGSPPQAMAHAPEASGSSTAHGPVAMPPARLPMTGEPSPSTVDPNAIYSSEPAPMGIADFGVGTGGSGYTYTTTEFLGTFSWQRMNISKDGDSSFTNQLNVVLQFVDEGVTYAYWIQDVAFLNSSTGFLWFENNIWNLSSRSMCLSNSAVQGNGTVYSYEGCEGYYAVTAYGHPGSYIYTGSPGTLSLLVRSYLSSGNVPEVAFEYFDDGTSGYVTYDNVVWPWATQYSADNNFRVDGTQYNPAGIFYDAEFILGGPGGGSSTEARAGTNASTELEYWNGHNFEAPPSAWNFGSNTAETISDVESIPTHDAAGLPYTRQLNGTSTDAIPEAAYDQAEVGVLSVKASGVASGTIAIPRDAWSFVGDWANLTLHPGDYEVWVNWTGNSADLGLCDVPAGGTLSVSVSAGCAPAVSAPAATPGGADVGQSVTFNTSVLSAGSGGDGFAWHVTPTGLGCSSSDSPTLECDPAVATTYRINVTITDSEGASSVSPTISYTVASDPTVGSPMADPTSIETGANVTFTASPSGGRVPYSYVWGGLPTPCVGTSTGTVTCTPSTPGVYDIGVTVVDANNFTAESPVLDYTVLVGPSVDSLVASPATVDLGGSTIFTATGVSGGTGSYRFAWSGLPPGCASRNESSLSCGPSAAGRWNVTLTVTDTDGGTAERTVAFVAYPDLAIGELVATPGSVDVGQAARFTAENVTGGSGDVGYDWAGLPAGCAGTDEATVSCPTLDPATVLVNLTVTDSDQGSANRSVSLTIDPDPTIAEFESSRQTLSPGQSFALTVTVEGGAAPLVYQYSGLPPGCSSADLPSLSCAPQDAGMFTITVEVTDANGVSANSTARVAVASPSSGPGPSPGPAVPEEYLLLAVVAVVGAGVAAAALAGRKSRRERRLRTEGRQQEP